MNKETGGPAFPNKQEYSEHGNSWFQYETGMTFYGITLRRRLCRGLCRVKCGKIGRRLLELLTE